MVSHLIQDAHSLGGYAVVLHQGRVVETGPTERILQEPDSEITKHFLDGDLESVAEEATEGVGWG